LELGDRLCYILFTPQGTFQKQESCMNLKRGSVLGLVLFSLVASVTVEAQAQSVPGRLAALQAELDQALASIAQLHAALAREAKARREADAMLDTGISSVKGGGVTRAVLDAAIATESSARSAALAALAGQIDKEAAARASFDATLTPLAALATYVGVDHGTINDLSGPHVVFTGVNVHIRSGDGSGNSYTENGRGNLILGYNEPSDSTFPTERAGSHNLVVGPNHRYNFGVGLVVGGSSRLGNDGASVSGGFLNSASGLFSSVGAGLRNDAAGDFAAVSGGADNVASGNTAAVSGGQMNQATGDLSGVTGGFYNTASGIFSVIGGGSSLVNSAAFTFMP
jgi:hypothetical protein